MDVNEHSNALLDASVNVVVKQGKGGKWRTEAFNADGVLVFVSPVQGYFSSNGAVDVAAKHLLINSLTILGENNDS